MARFYPLYVRRSDGKLEIIGKGKRKEKNTPTDEQMDQKPDKNGVSDYYREVAPDEMKHLDWRRKLGGMLARELEWKGGNGGYHGQLAALRLDAYSSRENGYMLAVFPENYRLYEHVKKTVKDGKTEVKSKTHAAGGNDRQDAYLYGHPAGRKKRYRSPADYFPHLLWLCTDESGDPDNCGCKICSPEDLEDVIPGAKNVKPEKPIKQEFVTKPPVSQAGATMQRQGSAQGVKIKPEPSAPSPRTATTPRQPVPTPLPQRRNSDQHIDSQYHSFMYRPGELVWFRREQAWGLGVVLRRWVTSSNQYHYTVQPLSHPFTNWSEYAPVTKSADSEMRPWLAWSVPRFTNLLLNDLRDPPRFDAADWQGIKDRRYGAGGDMVVDGSILAAKAVDETYTPLDVIKTTTPEPGVTETHYTGLFLGAEKIWVGDPVRLQVGAGTDIAVIHTIVERKRTSAMGNQVLQQSVHLNGDVYSLAQVSHSNSQLETPASTRNNPQLPHRLTEDLAFRNARSITAKRTASYWKLIAAQHHLELNTIKGRWYEASLLLPILQAGAFEETARKGEIQEASLWMNSRGDCQNANRASSLPKVAKRDVRKDTRREALGRAVPANTEIIDGISPPLPDNVDPALEGGVDTSSMDIDPHFETADGAGHSGGGQDINGDGGLDQFMNPDFLDDGTEMPGFGQEYASQQSQSGYY